MKDLVVVDIQPEYESVFTFDIADFCNFLNKNSDRIVYYLYNGYNTLGMVEEYELIDYLTLNGLESTDNIVFYDKGYDWFRDLIDNNFDKVDLVKLYTDVYSYTKIYNNNDYNESEEYEKFKKDNQDLQELFEYIEMHDIQLFIPEVTELLDGLNNIDVCGGGEYECLLEIEIILEVLDIKYDLMDEYVY